jgi:signal transduction histidine kinase
MTQADFGLRLPVGSSHDELSELGSAFNHLLDQLQTAFDRQSRFAGDAAHQLRNPLAVLQGQLDVARRRPRTTEEYVRTLDVLADQAAELRQIVESLLFLAHSDADASPPQYEQLALDEWLPQYVTRWDGHPRKDDLRVQAESQAIVSASGPLLSQLLDNLIGNAFKYSQSGTTVSIVAERERDRALVAVADHGIGILPKDRRTIFEPFYRCEAARRGGYPGTGLGLSVAGRIAAVLNGELKCDSAPGQGSTFTLSLPVVLAANHPCGEAGSAQDT